MFYQITDKEGHILISNLQHEEGHFAFFKKCKLQNETFVSESKKYRHGILHDESGSAYLITDDKEVVDRPRLFKEKLRVQLELIPIIKNINRSIRDKVDTHTRRLLHNLASLNGHNIQEIFNLISEEELREKKDNRKKFILQKVKERIENIPEAFMHIMKNNAAIKMEFSVFEKLREINPKIKKTKHRIRKAIMNILHIFFQDFGDLGIKIQVDETDIEIYLDFEVFQVALYHLIDNATKYAMKESDINIRFVKEEETFNIVIEMISLRIKEEEKDKITQEYFCGESAKKVGKNGQGIGMFIVKRVLKLNGAHLEILPNINSQQITLDGNDYEKNAFIIKFPKNLIAN